MANIHLFLHFHKKFPTFSTFFSATFFRKDGICGVVKKKFFPQLRKTNTFTFFTFSFHVSEIFPTFAAETQNSNTKQSFKISCEDGRDNGCISNTVAQVTAQPNRISVALNKSNLTTELIQRSGRFTASIISEAADFELFKHFGFQSGRTVDKFADFTDCRRVGNGTLAITRGTNTFISADVEQAIDLGTHMLFIGAITEIAFCHLQLLPAAHQATASACRQDQRGQDHLALQHLRL